MSAKADLDTIANKRSSHLPRLAFWLGIALLAIGAMWYWSSTRDPGTVVNYVTMPAMTADLVVKITATGTVEPTNQVDISSELSGRISIVNVNYNDKVKVGQPLAELDTDKLKANVESARATLTARQAAVIQAEATQEEMRDAYDRATNLQGQGISSRETLLSAKAAFQRAKAAVDSAKADVKVAEANLKLEQTNLDKACICSPINGIVLLRAVEPGQTVASSLQAPTLFTLAEDLSTMKLTVDIDEADIGKVNSGDKAEFSVEAYQDRTFEATITQLRFAPQTVEGVVTYEGVLDVDNSDLQLRPGMTATAEITVDEVNGALAVPNAALRFTPRTKQTTRGNSRNGLLGMIMPRPPRGPQATSSTVPKGGERSVYLLRDGQAVEVKVRTGATDGNLTQIVEGDVRPGDQVIVDTETDG